MGRLTIYQQELHERQLDIVNMSTLSADGVSTFRGHRAGVGAQLRQMNPSPLYYHCRHHLQEFVVECRYIHEVPNSSFVLIIFHNFFFLVVIRILFGPISSVDAAWGINSLIVL